MCCGRKREAMKQQWPAISVTPGLMSSATTSDVRPRTPIVFRGAGACVVTGPRSREVYHFSSRQPEQWVDPQDATELVNTGLFHAKG
jgi:hypothetical protein